MLFRWAVRELRRGWRSALFFVLNLSLGLTGFIALEAYKDALRDHVDANRQQILGGDLSVSVRREFTAEETAVLNEATANAKSSIVYDFFAMVTSRNGARLVLTKAIDGDYPLYGTVGLADGSTLKLDPEGIWIYPELAEQLDLNIGDALQIGELNLTIRGLITADSAQTFRSAGFAPHVFIDRSRLADSKLIQFGSTYSMIRLYRLPDPSKSAEIEKALEAKIADPAVRIETAAQAGGDSARQMGYLADFLGLVALVGLFLAALGGAYLWRLFLQQRTKDVAILRALGLDSDQAILLFVIQAGLLGAVALIPAVVVAQIVFPFLNALLASMTPFDLHPVLTPRSILLGLALSLGTSFLIALPFLLRLRALKPARLFSEGKFDPDIELRRPWALLPAAGLMWALSVLQANSFRTGGIFTGALLAVVVVLTAAGWLCLRGLRGIESGPWDVKHGLRSTARRPGASLAVFVALGLGSLLINILPQVKTSLQSEFSVDGDAKRPSLFMFDIQDEQLQAVRDAAARNGATLTMQSPLIRSRLLKVNDVSYERVAEDGNFRTREAEREARFRNRGVNLSFRERMSDAEEITEGRPFSGVWTEDGGRPAEVSVESSYAERMGLKIGDRLLFDVQGAEIPAEIVSLRRVKWTSFQPNFFVLIQPGVLDDAPKTWIVSTSNLPANAKKRLENELATALPNVSIVDVERTVASVLKLGDQMSWALEFMAALAVLTGAVVLYSIARSQARSRRAELNLLKILGAAPANVRRYLLSEFALLAGLSSLIGAVASVAVAGILLWQLFNVSFAFDPAWLLASSLGITLLGVAVAERASAKLVTEKPVEVFREG